MNEAGAIVGYAETYDAGVNQNFGRAILWTFDGQEYAYELLPSVFADSLWHRQRWRRPWVPPPDELCVAGGTHEMLDLNSDTRTPAAGNCSRG